jgi:hypothetical protein
MEIKLMIEGKEKTFTAPFISGRMVRKTLEMNEKYDLNNIKVETLDTLVDYVVDIYGSQFTRDDYYDGVPAHKLLSTIMETAKQINARVMSGEEDPNQ